MFLHQKLRLVKKTILVFLFFSKWSVSRDMAREKSVKIYYFWSYFRIISYFLNYSPTLLIIVTLSDKKWAILVVGHFASLKGVLQYEYKVI